MHPARQGLVEALFPDGMPGLWCPPLTHFDACGRIDRGRIEKHLQQIVPHVRGLLVPGSTGEGWQLRNPEIRELLTIVIAAAQRWNLHVLIGALKHDTAEMVETITATAQAARNHGRHARLVRHRSTDSRRRLCRVRAAGGEDLTQEQILAGLEQVLQLQHPTALYQLPQVTGNEISPATFLQLVDRYSNLFLLKDTSGQDWVARAGIDPAGVFLVRDAEGGYSRWLKSAGGPYDGLLLSSANNFAPQLAEIQRWLSVGQRPEADALADRVECVVNALLRRCRRRRGGEPVHQRQQAVGSRVGGTVDAAPASARCRARGPASASRVGRAGDGGLARTALASGTGGTWPNRRVHCTANRQNVRVLCAFRLTASRRRRRWWETQSPSETAEM